MASFEDPQEICKDSQFLNPWLQVILEINLKIVVDHKVEKRWHQRSLTIKDKFTRKEFRKPIIYSKIKQPGRRIKFQSRLMRRDAPSTTRRNYKACKEIRNRRPIIGDISIKK